MITNCGLLSDFTPADNVLFSSQSANRTNCIKVIFWVYLWKRAAGFGWSPSLLIQNSRYMLLRELQPGQRFTFSDRNTPVELEGRKAQHSAAGTFQYVGTGQNGCPVIKDVRVGIVLTAIANTYYRWVIILF